MPSITYGRVKANTVREGLAEVIQPYRWSPAGLAGLTFTVQYEFADPLPDDLDRVWLDIVDGTITPHEGICENPNLTVRTTATKWLALLNETWHGCAGLQDGSFKVSGPGRYAVPFIQSWLAWRELPAIPGMAKGVSRDAVRSPNATVRGALATLANRWNADLIGDKSFTLQYVLSNSLPDDIDHLYVTFSSGAPTVFEGSSSFPDVTLEMKASDFVLMSNGQFRMAAADARGDIQITGNKPLACLINKCHRRHQI